MVIRLTCVIRLFTLKLKRKRKLRDTECTKFLSDEKLSSTSGAKDSKQRQWRRFFSLHSAIENTPPRALSSTLPRTTPRGCMAIISDTVCSVSCRCLLSPNASQLPLQFIIDAAAVLNKAKLSPNSFHVRAVFGNFFSK